MVEQNHSHFQQIPGSSYTIQTVGGCRLAFGPVPAADFTMLCHGFSKKAVMAPDIAYRIGATLVIGDPDDIEALRQQNLPVSEARKSEANLARACSAPASVVDWLENGERGLSSEAMCQAMHGHPLGKKRTDHPRDPDDLSRCIKFLDATQSHDEMEAMRAVSPEWNRLVDAWGDITASFHGERPTGSAPLTYALMRDAINPVTETDPCKL